MKQPNERRKYLWIWALAGWICLAAGAVWAGGVVYVGDRDGSEDAFLGVTLTEEVDHPEGGARVVGVVDDSPAAEAGILEGDIIQGVDGAVVRGPKALSKRLEDREPGDQVAIDLVRDGGMLTVDVELGERSHILHWSTGGGGGNVDTRAWTEWAEELGEKFGDEYVENWSVFADELDDSIRVVPDLGGLGHTYLFRSSGRPKLGVQLSEATPELREHFGGESDTGVLISKILPDTPAADAGLRVGDLIMAIDGEPVATAGEIVDELRDKEGVTFPIQVVRDGRSLTVDVTIPERDEDSRPSGPRAFFVRPAPPRVPAPGALEAPPAPRAPAELPALQAPPVPRALYEVFAPPALPAPRVKPELPAVPQLPAPPTPAAPPARSGARGLRVV